MSISESVTQEWTVASAPRGPVFDVVAINTDANELLMVHGIRPGAQIVVQGDAPFGGPRIVRIGRSRVAIDRRLATAIVVVGHDSDQTASAR